MFLAAQALVDQGDEIITCFPDYPFNNHVKYAGGSTVFLHLKKEEGFRIDLDKLEKLVTKKTKAIMIDNPHNPTGRVFTKDELKGVAEIVEKYDLYLLSDTASELLIWNGHEHINMSSFPGMFERGATTSSVSKCYGMGGWRVGYIASNEQFIKKILPLHAMINNVGPPTFVQEGATQLYRMLSDPMSRKPIINILNKCEEMKNIGFKRFNEMPNLSCHNPEGGGVLLVDITKYKVSTNVFTKFLLREAKVLVRPADRYNAPGYIRIAFGLPRFPEVLDRIEEVLPKF
jgi:aspartate/methionine/tyrosine aminotransferase